MRRIIVLALALTAAPAHAQIFGTQREPQWWVGLGIGAYNAGNVADGKTGSVWDFGNRTTAQYRASLEKTIRNQSSIGLLGTYMRAPIGYRGTAVTGSCISCAAHLDMYSLSAMFHAGGGPGFHQVIEAAAGITSYQNFTRDSDGSELEPKTADRDFSFAVGYGFGYTMSSGIQLDLVQDYGLALHPSDGTGSGESNTLRSTTTRATVRFGLGGGRGVGRPRFP